MVAMTLPGHAKPDMKFRRLDARTGLSNSQVNCILKDSKGFVWIGTKYGLNRYDGYRFRVFHSNIKDTTALIYDYVDNLYEDSTAIFGCSRRHSTAFTIQAPNASATTFRLGCEKRG